MSWFICHECHVHSRQLLKKKEEKKFPLKFSFPCSNPFSSPLSPCWRPLPAQRGQDHQELGGPVLEPTHQRWRLQADRLHRGKEEEGGRVDGVRASPRHNHQRHHHRAGGGRGVPVPCPGGECGGSRRSQQGNQHHHCRWPAWWAGFFV